MYETMFDAIGGKQQIEVEEYLAFLASMDNETLDTFFAIEQERIQVETINYL